LIVGDGKKVISPTEVKETNKKGTPKRIDIWGHGLAEDVIDIVSTEEKAPEKFHKIDVYDEENTETSALLKDCRKTHGPGLHVHIWSCYAGAAKSHVSELGEGAVLQLHCSDNEVSWI